MSSPKAYVSINLKGDGTNLISGIGLAVTNRKGVLILKNEWWIQSTNWNNGETFCGLKEHPELVEYAKSHSRSEKEVITEFAQFCNRLPEVLAIVFQQPAPDVVVVEGNSQFDTNRSFYIDFGANVTSVNTDSFIEVCKVTGMNTIVEEAADKIVSRSGHPQDDAHNTIIQHLIILKLFDKKLKRHGNNLCIFVFLLTTIAASRKHLGSIADSVVDKIREKTPHRCERYLKHIAPHLWEEKDPALDQMLGKIHAVLKDTKHSS